ncbi:MAG: ABC transporter permease [Cytophagia bacterium]|nr:ABC transporter permease [Cytophagia bacterium]
MFKNYFKIAFRTLWKNKAYAFINIIGLAIGISGSVLLLNYVQEETSFESLHENRNRILRPILTRTDLPEPRSYASNSARMANEMVEAFPEVEAQTTISQFFGGQFNMTIDGEPVTERAYIIADENFFQIFDFPLISGRREGLLSEPKQLVISESKAIALFGKADVVGTIVETAAIGQMEIVAVMEDMPSNGHLQIDFILSPSFAGIARWDQEVNSLTSASFSSYILLRKGTDISEFQAKASQWMEEQVPEQFANMVDFGLQPLTDIHFNSADLERDLAENKGVYSYVVTFTLISVFLLFIASINYMNLSTSKAVFRAKEIGIRKVVGAVKSQLIIQFLTESLVISIMAMLITIGALDLIMPYFNELTGKSFEFSWSTLGDYLPLLLGVTILVAFISGIYPAFFMTRIKTVSILKGEKLSGGGIKLREGLVILQFVLGIFMIISTLVVSNQMRYISEKNLGFNEENLMVIDINNGAVRPVFKAMRNEFNQIPGVEDVAVVSRVPGEWKNINEVDVLVRDGQNLDSAEVYLMTFDPHSLDVFDFKLADGEFFEGNDSGDSTKIMVNQAFIERFGIEDPLGKTVEIDTRLGRGSYIIQGVMEDFHFQSLHSSIQPLVIGAWNHPAAVIDYFVLKYSGNTAQLVEAANLVHQKFDNRTVMEYHFLDEQLALFYEQESQAKVIFNIGASLSLFVACLGLFGLASFTIQKRMKELGIRKVLGASEWRIFAILSGSFTKQILLAFIIASPIAYWMMNNWLDNFQYRVGVGVGVFAIAGLGTLLIALLTISYRALRAANSNPVNSLRSE